MIREYIIKISDEIMEEEIADRPQELVRCKYCKWYSEKGFCKHPDGGAGNIRPADWFCADGERRSE